MHKAYPKRFHISYSSKNSIFGFVGEIWECSWCTGTCKWWTIHVWRIFRIYDKYRVRFTDMAFLDKDGISCFPNQQLYMFSFILDDEFDDNWSKVIWDSYHQHTPSWTDSFLQNPSLPLPTSRYLLCIVDTTKWGVRLINIANAPQSTFKMGWINFVLFLSLLKRLGHTFSSQS